MKYEYLFYKTERGAFPKLDFIILLTTSDKHFLPITQALVFTTQRNKELIMNR